MKYWGCSMIQTFLGGQIGCFYTATKWAALLVIFPNVSLLSLQLNVVSMSFDHPFKIKSMWTCRWCPVSDRCTGHCFLTSIHVYLSYRRSMCDVVSWRMCAWTLRCVTVTPQEWMYYGLAPPWSLTPVGGLFKKKKKLCVPFFILLNRADLDTWFVIPFELDLVVLPCYEIISVGICVCTAKQI